DGRVGGADPSLVDRRAVLGGEALRLDDVFHAERDGRERAAAERLLGRDLDPRVNLNIEIADPVDRRLQRASAHLARRVLPIETRLETRRSCGGTRQRRRHAAGRAGEKRASIDPHSRFAVAGGYFPGWYCRSACCSTSVR